GAAWVFSRSPAGWQGQKAAADPGRARFGEGVSVSEDGKVPIFGAPFNAGKSGAAWVGLPPPAVSALAPTGGPAGGGTEVALTGAGFTEAGEAHFGAASAPFSIVVSKPVTLRVKLNAAGRALLKARHGKLRASLVVLRVAPAPSSAQSASVGLQLRKKA